MPKAGFPLTRIFEMSFSLAAKEFIKVSPCGVSWAVIERFLEPSIVQGETDGLQELADAFDHVLFWQAVAILDANQVMHHLCAE